jgi:hypothetical protein
VVALYMGFCAGDGTPVSDIVQAARHLVRGFFAATRHAGGRRENPSLGILPAASTSILIAAPASALASAPALISASTPASAPAPAPAPVALAPASAPVSAPASLSEETGERIASALKALVDLYSGSLRDQNPLAEPFYKSLKEGSLSKESS